MGIIKEIKAWNFRKNGYTNWGLIKKMQRETKKRAKERRIREGTINYMAEHGQVFAVVEFIAGARKIGEPEMELLEKAIRYSERMEKSVEIHRILEYMLEVDKKEEPVLGYKAVELLKDYLVTLNFEKLLDQLVGFVPGYKRYEIVAELILRRIKYNIKFGDLGAVFIKLCLINSKSPGLMKRVEQYYGKAVTHAIQSARSLQGLLSICEEIGEPEIPKLPKEILEKLRNRIKQSVMETDFEELFYSFEEAKRVERIIENKDNNVKPSGIIRILSKIKINNLSFEELAALYHTNGMNETKLDSVYTHYQQRLRKVVQQMINSGKVEELIYRSESLIRKMVFSKNNESILCNEILKWANNEDVIKILQIVRIKPEDATDKVSETIERAVQMLINSGKIKELLLWGNSQTHKILFNKRNDNVLCEKIAEWTEKKDKDMLYPFFEIGITRCSEKVFEVLEQVLKTGGIFEPETENKLKKRYIEEYGKRTRKKAKRVSFKFGNVLSSGKIPRPKRRPGNRKGPQQFRTIRRVAT